MKVLLFDRPDKVGADELRRDLLLLPSWRKRQVLAYRHLIDQVECAKAYLLLHQCLAGEYGIQTMPDFEYGEYGKPMLSQAAMPHLNPSVPFVHFNLSHCLKGVMCVVNEEPVGCDIETIPEELDADLMSACFSQAEQETILSAVQPTVEFTKLWTRKEALLKLDGIGLVDELPGLLTSSLASGVELCTVIPEARGYVYTIAKKRK